MEDSCMNNGLLVVSAARPYLKSQQFCGREDITKVILEPGIRFMEEEVFAECPALEEVILPEGLVNIGIAAFAGCSALASVTLPSSLKTIEEGAFLDCESLRSVRLPEGLQEIRQLAFQASGLESVTIPAGVKEIGEEAFFECASLRSANVLGRSTRLGENAFGSSYALLEGYMAPGYPEEQSASAELLYSLLWAGCPDRHTVQTCGRAEAYIRANEALVMERILKYNNIPAMTGISARRLLDQRNIDGYVKQAVQNGLTEITALLIRAKESRKSIEEEFEL